MLVLCVLIRCLSFVSILHCIHYQCLFVYYYLPSIGEKKIIRYKNKSKTRYNIHSVKNGRTFISNRVRLLMDFRIESCEYCDKIISKYFKLSI